VPALHTTALLLTAIAAAAALAAILLPNQRVDVDPPGAGIDVGTAGSQPRDTGRADPFTTLS